MYFEYLGTLVINLSQDTVDVEGGREHGLADLLP